jgi:uncharacterized protein (DUF433 family)
MTKNDMASTAPVLGGGIYTVPDAGRILHLPQSRLGRWVTGYWRITEERGRVRSPGLLDAGVWGDGKDRALNFLGLMELFTFAALRERGVSAQRIRKAREELQSRFNTPFPFASHKLLSDGRRVMVVLDDLCRERLLILGEKGQLALREILEPFCEKIEFSSRTELVSRFWPLGRERYVVIDPCHGFGRPTLRGTNTSVEAVVQMVHAGETRDAVAEMYAVPVEAVVDAVEFGERRAA